MWPVAMDGIIETFITISLHVDALCLRIFNSKISHSAFLIGVHNFFLKLLNKDFFAYFIILADQHQTTIKTIIYTHLWFLMLIVQFH